MGYRHNFQHLLPGDVSVAVEVVHGEGPLELLFQFTARCHRQGAQKLPEIDGAVGVGVERPKHVLRKLRSKSEKFNQFREISSKRGRGRGRETELGHFLYISASNLKHH